MLLVDAANVVGSRPNGWWRDRGRAAANLCRQLLDAIASNELEAPVVVVLEGAARRGNDERDESGLRIVHARRSGDDAIVDLVVEAAGEPTPITVVTADRELRERVRQLGADVVGPRWLWERL